MPTKEQVAAQGEKKEGWFKANLEFSLLAAAILGALANAYPFSPLLVVCAFPASLVGFLLWPVGLYFWWDTYLRNEYLFCGSGLQVYSFSLLLLGLMLPGIVLGTLFSVTAPAWARSSASSIAPTKHLFWWLACPLVFAAQILNYFWFDLSIHMAGGPCAGG
ncbi:MAG: hypothetical protein KGO53_10065 [Alphaproteobacteria bacterium]|nr:hypothetical protein [Alphaproteobacteria bacterium]